MTIQLNQPLLSGGLRSINFFNGRLLSAEDLSQDQVANRQAHQYLGQAIGQGVAFGLDVQETGSLSTKQTPVVTVAAGLAVNRLGQALSLAEAADVALARPLSGGSGPVTALFADCQPLQSGPYVVGAGVYLLTILPASGTDGRAPVSGLGNLDAACNARYQVDGVQFRLLQVPLAGAELSDTDHLRNRLAYRCYGAGDATVTTFPANPFGPVVASYGLLDELRPDCLTDEEVPLALIYWTAADGLKFIDRWAVRRRLTRPAADTDWRLLTSDRRLSEAEAMFLQFEDQIEALRGDVAQSLGSIAAADRFRYLPPAGLVPITGQNSLAGFNWTTFFGSLAPEHLEVMDGALLPYLIRESFHHQPMLLGASSSEQLTLYQIRENLDAVQAGTAPQLALVFARASVAYCGVARFDYSPWDAARFP